VLSSELKCEKTTQADFQYRVEMEKGTADVLSMNVVGPFVRKRRDVTLKVVNHIVQPDTEQDVLMVSVVERFGRNGNKSLAFCSGWKLKKGAMASSAAPDDNNIVVMGADARDMSIAVNHLIENGGGQVIVADGKIVEFLALPVGGIASDLDAKEIAHRETLLNRAAHALGCDLPEPLMYMFFLPITAIPDYAITDVGPVDCIALKTFDPILGLSPEKQGRRP
jgi:adenine deaminase